VKVLGYTYGKRSESKIARANCKEGEVACPSAETGCAGRTHHVKASSKYTGTNSTVQE